MTLLPFPISVTISNNHCNLLNDRTNFLLTLLNCSGLVFPTTAAVDVEEEVNFHQKDRWKARGKEAGREGEAFSASFRLVRLTG